MTHLPHIYNFVIVLDYALQMAIEGKEDLGFQLHVSKSQSRRVGTEVVTDFDFAHDISIII